VNNWLKYPIKLTGESVELLPLEEKHFHQLGLIANDVRIWEFYPFDMSSSDKIINSFKSALIEKEKGSRYSFVIYNKRENKIIGATDFLNIQPKNKNLEIGATWLHHDYWATEINLECKFLLLTYCFEILGAIRVQLKTDEKNIRSKKAIQKIGATYEGTLRNNLIKDNGVARNSMYFSIIEEEWEDKKQKLFILLESKRACK